MLGKAMGILNNFFRILDKYRICLYVCDVQYISSG
jgi:hypothetical protein